MRVFFIDFTILTCYKKDSNHVPEQEETMANRTQGEPVLPHRLYLAFERREDLEAVLHTLQHCTGRVTAEQPKPPSGFQKFLAWIQSGRLSPRPD